MANMWLANSGAGLGMYVSPSKGKGKGKSIEYTLGKGKGKSILDGPDFIGEVLDIIQDLPGSSSASSAAAFGEALEFPAGAVLGEELENHIAATQVYEAAATEVLNMCWTLLKILLLPRVCMVSARAASSKRLWCMVNTHHDTMLELWLGLSLT
jgi:hypothetical protein